ncbi:hypothetical protein HZ993_09280 [Rhodoferax sp. AJA081-3]|uniref:hypothetical protein n=1 Tax=Rhodoferax sp. AJA081-3 TaxID=2752316 RepID=UPI001ADF31F1|nr:hypothetical protein [Rhodoferax sp. AJA081-3]QTN29972.1 hypothetical protein HZ993_09280 [Rhodoferax sp. AJA081-3]
MDSLQATGDTQTAKSNSLGRTQGEVGISLEDWIALFGEQRSTFRAKALVDVSIKVSNDSAEKILQGKKTEGLKSLLLVYTLNDYISELPQFSRSNEWRANRKASEEMKAILLGGGVTAEVIKISRQYLNSYLKAFQIPTQKAPAGWIDVVGIYPGYSSKEEVSDLKTKFGLIDIGGYGVMCADEYNEKNILVKLVCLFGKDDLTTDLASGEGSLVSNSEVFQVFVKGFTKKLGKPKTSAEKLETKFGVKIESVDTLWTDKFGNELNVVSVANKVGRGALILTSKSYMNMYKEKAQASKESRRF